MSVRVNKKVYLLTDSFRWPHEAILLLLTVYKDKEHHLIKGKITHKKFWEIISSELIANNYNVTGIQCKSKMAGLKNTYKNVKDHNTKSGNSRRTWRYFDVSRMTTYFIKNVYFLVSIKITLYVVSFIHMLLLRI